MLLIYDIHDAYCFMACKLLGYVWYSKFCTKFLLWGSANGILKLFDDWYMDPVSEKKNTCGHIINILIEAWWNTYASVKYVVGSANDFGLFCFKPLR